MDLPIQRVCDDLREVVKKMIVLLDELEELNQQETQKERGKLKVLTWEPIKYY